MFKRYIGLVCVLTFSLAACSQAEVSDVENAPDEVAASNGVAMSKQENLGNEQLMEAIRQQLRPANASSPEHCKAVGVGIKTCGGYERYLIYSTETTDETALLGLIARYNEVSRSNSQGMVSDCRVIPEPSVDLYNGMCRATRRVTN